MIHVNVATKYDVEFEEYPYPAVDFLEFIEDLREYSDDIVGWHNEDDTAFELDKEPLKEFQQNECQENSVYYKYIEELIKMSPERSDFIRIELY